MDITSDAQLMSVITTGVNNALREVMEKGYELLQDEISGAGVPAHGDGLWNAWEKTFGMLTAQIEFDPGVLTLEQLPFPSGRHGSSMAGRKGGSPPSDVRDGFADIIFKGLAPISPMLGKAGGTQPPRDGWTPFLLGVSRKIDTWMVAALTAQGFVVS